MQHLGDVLVGVVRPQHHLPAHLGAQVYHSLFLVFVGDHQECLLRVGGRMPHHGGRLTSLLHHSPVCEAEALADGARLQVELIDLHVLADGDEYGVPRVRVLAVHHLHCRPAVVPGYSVLLQ